LVSVSCDTRTLYRPARTDEESPTEMKTLTAFSRRIPVATRRPVEGPASFLKRLIRLPCVFCGQGVAVKEAGPDAFAICREDDARLDVALARLKADVLALLERKASPG